MRQRFRIAFVNSVLWLTIQKLPKLFTITGAPTCQNFISHREMGDIKGPSKKYCFRANGRVKLFFRSCDRAIYTTYDIYLHYSSDIWTFHFSFLLSRDGLSSCSFILLFFSNSFIFFSIVHMKECCDYLFVERRGFYFKNSQSIFSHFHNKQKRT